MPYALINGQNIFFEDSGGMGCPIVMMHGFLMDQSLFDPQVDYLAPTYRCIRFDARAFGKTVWDEKEFTLYDTVSDCVGLMDYLGISSAVVVGMSQGGYAALRLALRYPKRVMALVLMSSHAGIDDPSAMAQYRQMRDTWASLGPVEPLLEGLACALLGGKEQAGIKAMWDIWLPKWRMVSKTAIVHAMNNLLERDDLTHDVAKIKQPALVTHGDADVGMPIALGKALSEQLANCRQFLTVTNAAHAANFTHPQLINRALMDFLQAAENEGSLRDSRIMAQ